MTEITIDPTAMQPHEYFQVVKSSAQNINADMLQANLDVIAQQILHAQSIGQQNLMNQLAFTYDVVLKEQQLLVAGFDKFVYQDDVKKYLDVVKLVKIIELRRFPRAIPQENLAMIKKAQELALFDEFFVLFTDLTNVSHASEEDKAYVAKNKDPIVLGVFKHDVSNIKHHRMYLITDWQDEYCDLTWGNMIEAMAKIGMPHAGHVISTSHEYIQEQVSTTLESMKNHRNRSGSLQWFADAQPVDATLRTKTSENPTIAALLRLKSWISGK